MSTLRSYLVITVCLICQWMQAEANAPEGEVQCRRPFITEKEYISDNKEYYNKGEEIRVWCREGYITSTKTTRCDNPVTPQEWTPPIDLCRPLCRKPENTMMMTLDPEKTFYNIGDTVTVTCLEGYLVSYPSAQCVNDRFFIQWNNTLLCVALCRKPENTMMMTLDPEKTFYNIGDTVTVTCRVGYVPSYPSAQCVNRGVFCRWNNTLLCVEMCRKPEISILQLDPEKTFYNIGDTVTVKCRVGFVPSYPSAQCVIYRGFYNGWNTTVHCRALCRKPVDQVMVTMDPEKTFYDIGDTVTVKCPVGYVPSYPSAQCMNDRFFIEWSNYPQCLALCKKPEDRMMMDPEKTFYDIGDTVTVKCPVGFRNSYPSVQCVMSGRSFEWNNPPQCVGYCKKPTLGNVSSFYVNKRHYKKGEWIAVQCKLGYSPTFETMRCDRPRSSKEWTPPTVTCIAQCKRPTIDNVDNLFMDKGYYNKGEWLIIRCKSGYYPTSSLMRCNNPHASLEWSPPTVTCIGVTFINWKVTSISISFQLSCTPQCPDTWRFTVQLCPKTDYYYYYSGSCKDLNGKGGTFTDLKPSSKYNIQTKLYTEHEEFNLVDRVIWTDDSVTDQPEILKVPSMEDNTIRWRLSEEWGNITGFQMNISAWRDYNVSFAVDESLQFPPNLTEYKIPLQYGTNYTIALRGLTTSGATTEVTTENIETDIGDPPLHMEKTIHGDTLQLYPVPNLNGPIRSYEVIVFGGQEDNSTKECLTFKTTPYNFTWSPTRYTAVVLPAENLTEPRTFILGDNHHYNGFHNAPLMPNANYTVYIRVTSRWKHVETSSCAFAGVIKGVTCSSLIPVLSGSSLGIIIGLLVLILLVLLCLVVVHFTPWMKQKLLRERI